MTAMFHGVLGGPFGVAVAVAPTCRDLTLNKLMKYVGTLAVSSTLTAFGILPVFAQVDVIKSALMHGVVTVVVTVGI
jgi:hypothetical protein